VRHTEVAEDHIEAAERDIEVAGRYRRKAGHTWIGRSGLGVAGRSGMAESSRHTEAAEAVVHTETGKVKEVHMENKLSAAQVRQSRLDRTLEVIPRDCCRGCWQHH